MAPNPRTPVDAVRSQIQAILLDQEELLDRNWQPSGTVSEFLRFNIRVAVFLLQRVSCDETGLNGPVPVVLPSEVTEIRQIIHAILGSLVRQYKSRVFGRINAQRCASYLL